jgi:hypothetical protein
VNLPNPILVRRVSLVMLMPALIVFSARAALEINGTAGPPGWMLAIVGILSGLAMLGFVVANWATPDKWRTVAAVSVALVGHYVVSNLFSPDLGGAMVYLGTGFLVSLHLRWAQFAGMIAGIGALFRHQTASSGQFLLIVGALGLAIAAGLAAFHKDFELIAIELDPKT